MKKLYTTQDMCDLSFSRSHRRSSLFKAVSLGTVIATLLSSVSPVIAANLAITGDKVQSSSGPSVSYQYATHGSIVLAGDNDNCGVYNVIGRGGSNQGTDKQITAEELYERVSMNKEINGKLPFNWAKDQLNWGGDGLTTTGAYMGKATGGLSNVMPEAYGVFSFATGCGSSATGHYSTAFGAGATAKRGGAQAFGIGALAGEQASIAIGVASEAVETNTIAIGGLAKAKGVDSIAFGNKSLAGEQQAIAIGYGAQAQIGLSIAIGSDARATENTGVALGSESVADVAAGAISYSSLTKGPSDSDNFAWKSTLGAVSVGDAKSEKTRQIVGVAAGSNDTDAVNVAQLKSLQSYVDQGWTLSVGGENAKAVGIKDTVDLSATSDNLTITKGAENNNVQFDLAKNITVERVTAGRSSMSNDGIIFADGARITVDGIDAGKKQITGVAAGKEPGDAVNFAQLQEIKNQIVGNSFVKQDGGEEGRITIGMATGGSEINIANKSGEDRTISGVKAAVNNNDAVNKQQLDGQIADVVDTIKSSSLVKREKETNRITIGKEIEGTEINIANKSGDARTISGVKEAVNDDEAVNKKQLDGEIADITDSIKVIKEANNFAVLYDKENGTINYNSVTLGGDKTRAPVALHNVQAGTISQDSHDAINGSQIEKISGDIANYFGGGASFENGAFKGPKYSLSTIVEDGQVANTNHYNVGDALTGLDANVKNVNSRLTHVTNEFNQKIDSFSKDALLWSEDEQAFVALHVANGEKPDSKITFLKDGDISANSTDAVNGSQLFATNQNVITVTNNLSKSSQNISKYFGGGADVAANKAPTYKIQNTEHNDVGSAFSSVNNSITNIQNQITNATKNSLVKQEENEGTITVGKATGGTEINVSNKSGGTRTISGVKAAVANNEAVNKEQLDKSIEKISKDINLTTAAAVLYDKNADGIVKYGSITLGGDKNKEPVALLNVKAGTIAKNSHDAINGSQIEKISGDIANYFGGDASFKNGAFKGPKYSLSTIVEGGQVAKANYYDVGSALSGLDANVKNVNDHLTNVTNDFTQQINNITQEVKGDALLWSKEEKAFVAQHGEGKTNSKIKFIAKGDITEDSTDAVNGSQLFETNQNVTTVTNNLSTIAKNISSYLGGGADVAANKAPTYKIQNTEHNDVGSAFSAVDNSITNIQNQIANVAKNSLVKQEENEGTITVGKATGGTKINVANKSGEDRTISGVKAAVNNDEAVNKEQLDKSIEKISKDINLTTAAAVLYDKENGAVNYGSITLGGDKNKEPVALLNVKDGTILQGSHDAINGGQINQISQDIANYFGGDAEFVEGAFIGPEYNLSTVSANGEVVQKTFENVGDALTGLDANVKHVNDHLINVTNDFTQKINNITQEVKGDALLWNGDEQAFVAQHGEGKTNSKIKFLANGDISANSTDAVNGSQLYLMSNQLAAYFGGGAGYNNGKWTAPTFKIAQFNNDGSSGAKKTYHDVANAFDGVSESMSKINNRIQNVENNVSSNGLNWNEQKKAYDASHDGQPSKIINVADGKIAEGSKDAVNGGQLWQTNERVTGVEKDVKHLTNRVDNISTTVTDMGETVFHIENRVDNIENTVNNLSDGAVNYDKDADGKKTNKITLKGGNESEPVMIDNVAAGRIEQGSKEAVNGGQLHDYTQEQMKIILDETKHYTDQRVNNIVINAIDDAVDRANQYTDMKFNVLSYDIKDVRKEARQAAAIGLAVSNLRYFDDPGSLSVSFGSGAWRGQSAFALGAGYTSENGKIRSNLSATSAGGHWGVGGAITLKIK